MSRVRRTGGFAYIAAVVFLVVLALLATAAVRLSTGQQATADQAVLGARAGLAANAGIEWGLAQLRTQACAPTAKLTDFVNDTGFRVTVSCSAQSYNEGEKPDSSGQPAPFRKTLYTLTAVACNGSADGCPDDGSAAVQGYVERKRVAYVCIGSDGSDCY